MKVYELINLLKTLPQDADVVTGEHSGRVSEYYDVEGNINVIYLKRSSNPNNEFYREAEEEDEGAFEAVELS